MFRKLINNPFLKSILTLSSGTILAQALVLISSPIMTRLYSPTEVGAYTAIITVISMFGGVLAGKYEVPIVSVDRDKKAYNLVLLSLVITIGSSLIISLFYTIYLYFFSDNNLSFIFLLFSLIFLLTTHGMLLIITSLNNRMNRYKTISSSLVIGTILKEIFIILVGFVYPRYSILVIALLIGNLTTLLIQVNKSFDIFASIKNTTITDLKEVGEQFRDQFLFSSPATFFNSFSYSSINLFIEFLFGVTMLGYYSISYRLLGIPISLVTNNVSRVYFKEASREYQMNGNYRKTFIRTSILLALCSIVFVTFLILLGPYTVSLIFGSQWFIAGRFIQILAPMFGLRIIVSPLTVGVTISNKQKYEFLIQVLFLVTSIILFLITLFLNLRINIYIMLISVFYSLIYLIYYGLLFKYSNK